MLLDSICFNELGDPDELVPPQLRTADRSRAAASGGGSGGTSTSVSATAASAAGSAGGGGSGASVADWRDIPRLKLLNLLYDATPMKYLTMVVTEVGVIPPTSVPAVIREASAREGSS